MAAVISNAARRPLRRVRPRAANDQGNSKGDRQGDIIHPPFQAGGQFDRRHAQVMHRPDPAAAHDRRKRQAGPARLHGADREGQRGHQDGNGQRAGGSGQTVARDHARIIAQHRHEVSGPDAETDGGARSPDPARRHRSGVMPGMAKQQDGGDRGHHADQRGKGDIPLVMLVANAEKYIVHTASASNCWHLLV
jgi:hypothetical protein